jgi:exo-beta-1,3-glucanase (GH17 family)
VDIVSANAFPFWEKKPIDGCIDYFYSRVQPLIQLANQANKKIMMGESGWASSGNGNPATSIASPENAAVTNMNASCYDTLLSNSCFG